MPHSHPFRESSPRLYNAVIRQTIQLGFFCEDRRTTWKAGHTVGNFGNSHTHALQSRKATQEGRMATCSRAQAIDQVDFGRFVLGHTRGRLKYTWLRRGTRPRIVREKDRRIFFDRSPFKMQNPRTDVPFSPLFLPTRARAPTTPFPVPNLRVGNT